MEMKEESRAMADAD